ncbi:GIY-YIG nuclease family protein [Methylorubrum sp. SB2]|uniref:GIY-YIG nuclease family protein n=1 Tax=Methylorubrum subtropicum TaxID=3138812 RepID=UPI00313C22B2
MICAVYLLARKRDGTLYLGVTRNLSRRIWEHKTKAAPGFTARHAVDRLVWYELHDRIDEAIAREKAIKKWHRAWKVALIEAMNPDWDDLYGRLNA